MEVAEKGSAIAIRAELEVAGAADEVSLTLTDPSLPYDRWEALGRFLGSLGRRCSWYVGDWLIFGEALYGESAAQGVEATTRERYSEAERVTGLDHGTLMNVRSVCSRVPRERRRPELPFSHHAEVASLEPDDQVFWLNRAVEDGLSRRALRDEIRGVTGEPSGADPVEPKEKDGPTRGERLEAAARRVWNEAISDGGSWIVPSEPMELLAAALGEDR